MPHHTPTTEPEQIRLKDFAKDETPPPEPLSIMVPITQTDPELQAIEACLFLLSGLPYETRLRAMTYLRDRIESDPSVWGTPPSTAGSPATEGDIAQILAESDGNTWIDTPTTTRNDYYRRAAALASVGVVLIRGT